MLLQPPLCAEVCGGKFTKSINSLVSVECVLFKVFPWNKTIFFEKKVLKVVLFPAATYRLEENLSGSRVIKIGKEEEKEEEGGIP